MDKIKFSFYVPILVKKNRLRYALFLFLLTGLFLFVSESHAQSSQAIWQRYLECVKNDITKGYVGDLTQLKLLKYTYKGKIKSEKNKFKAIEALYSDKAPVVSVLSNLVISDTTYTDTDITIHQKIYPNFEITTVRKMMDIGKLTQDSIATIKQRLYKNIGINSDYLELYWSYKGKRVKSLCIISNDSIPIDPIASMLFTSGRTIVDSRNPTNKK